MAKGDYIEFVIQAGDDQVTQRLVAGKIGRYLNRRVSGAWIIVEEMTKARRPTGNELRVRTIAVVSELKLTLEDVEPPMRMRKPKVSPGQIASPLAGSPLRADPEDAMNAWADRGGGLLFRRDYEGYRFPEEKPLLLERIREGLAVEESMHVHARQLMAMQSL